jgi:ABC-type molybdate transport system substrate-binding protein
VLEVAAMGRHYPVSRRAERPPVVVLSVLLVVVLAGWFTFDFLTDKLGASNCESTTTVTLSAAPDVAPVIAQIARQQSADDCYQVRVSALESAAVAESLIVSDGTDSPDVWIPESTLWLRRAQDAGAWDVPVSGTPVASSPVVLAATETVATGLGWPDTRPTWAQLIGPAARGTVGLADPARDPAGVSTLLGLRALVAGAPDPATASTVAMRALSQHTVAQQADLFAQLPDVPAFPTSEHAVLRHNAKQGGTPLVAIYAEVPALDYPYVVLPDTQDTERVAAERFLDRLRSRESTALLADAGFRTPDGKALRDRSKDGRTTAARMPPAPLPDAVEVEQVLAAWAGVNLSGRLQVLLDVSGSMGEQVPGTGKTRMAVTVEAASAGLGLFKPTTKVGLWLYATNLEGEQDYRVALPVLPISEHLAHGGLETLRSVETLPNGNTALYDAVLAAYQDSVRNWEPGRINAVVVMTDGKDDNASDVTLDQLLAELGKLQNPRRPLKLIGIGIGPDVDPAELTAIAGATGGQAFIAQDPSRIGDVFYAALSDMLCQPPACQPGS